MGDREGKLDVFWLIATGRRGIRSARGSVLACVHQELEAEFRTCDEFVDACEAGRDDDPFGLGISELRVSHR